MFRASNPVTASAFHDRTRSLEAVASAFRALAADAPRWLAIIGPRKVGKTSLILEAARRAPTAIDVAVFDAMARAPLDLELFRALALAAVDALVAESAGGSLSHRSHVPEEYRGLLHSSPLVAKLPAALRVDLDRLVDASATEAAVRGWLELPEELARALGRRLVLAIDEVQELASLRAGKFDPFPMMRAVWQRHTSVAYVISGSAPSMLRELVTARHSPFFHHFQILELGPFERSDAVALLVEASPRGRKISAKLAARIVDVVGGHPFYLQLIGEALTTLAPPYDDATLKPVLQSLIFSRVGRLGLYFENEYTRIVGRASTAAATLEAVAGHGPIRLSDVARRIGSSAASTSRYLERLGDAVVRDDAGRYSIADPLFGMWVTWRSPGGTVVPMRIIGDDAELAVAEHLAALGFELVYQSRASRGAFDLLALRGPDQLGVQVKRSPLPLRFTKAEWGRMEADAARWGWRWAIAAVGNDGTVRILDPKRATRGRQLRLPEEAVIDNVLRWIDRR